jgi:hypothetical protein
VVFYAVVSDEIQRVIEFFPPGSRRKRMLARVVGDEPDWRDTLHVEPIDLATGGPN